MKHGFEAPKYQKSTGVGLRRLFASVPLLALGLVACSSVESPAAAAPSADVARQHNTATPGVAAVIAPLVTAPTLQAVVAAREAMNRRQWSVLGELVPQADEDLLAMYPQYWALRYQLWNAPTSQWPTQAFERFMSRHADAYLSDKLRGDWLLAAGRRGDFKQVRQLGEIRADNAHIRCTQVMARHMTGSRVKATDATEVFEPNTACWTLFDQLVADGVLQWEDLQYFLHDAVEQNKPTEASRFAGYMFGPGLQKTFDSLYKNPMTWLKTQPKAPRDRVTQEMVSVALARLARTDREAGDLYIRREWAGQLPAANLAWVRSQFAIIAALNLDARADAWYREAGHVPMTEYSQAWKVRSALRQPNIDWKWVKASIDYMPKSQREEPVWVYWRARGQAALGQPQPAQKAYESIAAGHDFYGQLAREELGQQIVIPPPPSPLTAREIERARSHPGLQRAIALFRLGWRAEGVPEWNYSLRGMNDRELLAAAELARAEELFDRVVNTSERTTTEVDFTQRYVAPFEGRVSAQARRIDLDPAWVYGLIRQESRFVMNARSSVGASGLMQLMPGTAKHVANRIGMRDFTPSSVNDFETNTILGTNYLKMVLTDLNDSWVLATAGYNAGPRRPHTWRGTLSLPVEGAIFTETIPFTETRLYVKHVLSNATYYSAMFTGQPQSLKARLGTIVPQANESTTLP